MKGITVMPEGLQLDQLWYTWSTSGLEAIHSGYRVRAASDGLRETQSKRNRQLERYYQYSLPAGLDLNTFDAGTAPVSLSLVDHKTETKHERLLIRKVFKGLDTFKRGSVYFVHLIAGLPETFTARQAISLWNCSELWRDSDAELAPHITTLPTISYDYLLSCVKTTSKSFAFSIVGKELECLIQQILAEHTPPRIYATGQPNLIAALIYGWTDVLPTNMLANLTFTTYDHNPQQSEELFVGQTTMQELIGATGLHVQLEPATAPPLPLIELDYAKTAAQSLLNGNKEQLQRIESIVSSVEQRNQGKDKLISLFQRRFHRFPLDKEQLQDVLTDPVQNAEDLLDPILQNEWANALLKPSEYWQNEGRILFQSRFNDLHRLPPAAQNALLIFTLTLAKQIRSNVESVFDDLPAIYHWCRLLDTLVQQPYHQQDYAKFWYELLGELAQKPVYAPIFAGRPTELYPWLLEHLSTLSLSPQLDPAIAPWLAVTSWPMFSLLLERYTPLIGQVRTWPTEWLTFALHLPLARPTSEAAEAIKTITTHQQTLYDWMEAQLLYPANSQTNETLLQFFQNMFAYPYEKRIEWLISLLLHSTTNPDLVTRLLTIVSPRNQYSLSSQELLQILTTYSLDSEQTTQILTSLQISHGLPRNWTILVECWKMLTILLHKPLFTSQSLEEGAKTLHTIMKICQEEKMPDLSHYLINSLLPLFMKQIETEDDIQTILNFFEKALNQNRWDFLYRIAENAGKRYPTLEHSARHTPFLLYAIRYGIEPKGNTQFNMTLYLQALYEPAGNELLAAIDTIISYGFLGQPIQEYWRAWHKGEHNNHQDQSRKPSLAPNAEQEYRFVPAHQRNPANPSPNAYIQPPLAKLRTYEEYISLTTYYTLANALIPMVEFWLEHVFSGKHASQLPSFERDLFTKLTGELNNTSNDLSLVLCQLLVDNAIIKRIDNRAIKYVETYMRIFPAWIKSKHRQGRIFPDIPLETQKKGFSLLVRRYLFIAHQEKIHKNPQQQLEVARREADVEYLF